MSKMNLTEEELDRLEVLADLLFPEENANKCDINQFMERLKFCKAEYDLEKIYEEIVGQKDKNFKLNNLVKEFLTYKNEESKISENLKKFFKELVLEGIKLGEESIGDKSVKGKINTSASEKKRNYISKIKTYLNKEKIPQGFEIEYEAFKTVKLYLKSKVSQYTSEEFEMDLLGDPEELEKIVDQNNEYLYVDSIAEIYGTFTDKIESLGFVLRSGKRIEYGNHKGKPFIFGQPGQQFHYLKFRNSENGISFFEPYFRPTLRTNPNADISIKDITDEFLGTQKGLRLRAGKKNKNDDNVNCDNNPVFKEPPEALDSRGRVNQYMLENENGYIIGIENKTFKEFDMELKTAGLIIDSPSKYQGEESAVFLLKKNSKFVFYTSLKPDFQGETYFEFEPKV